MQVKAKTTSKEYKPEEYFIYRERNNHGNFPALLIANVLLEERTAKRYGHCVSMTGHINHKDRIRAFLITKDDVLKISKFILKKILENPDFITNTKIGSDRLSKELLRFIKQHQSLIKLTNKQLADTYLDYCKLYANYHFINTIPWVLAGDSLADYLKEYLSSMLSKKEVLKCFTLLATPTVSAYTSNQELEFLKIVIAVEADKNIISIFKKEKPAVIQKALKKQGKIWLLIKKHSEMFGWIPFDYIGPDVWDESYFIQQIKEFISSNKSARKALAKYKGYHKDLKLKQEKVKKKLKISKDDFRAFQDLQTLTVLQDNRKETAVQTHVWLEKIMRKEISKRLGVSVKALRYTTEKEISEMLLGRKILKESLEQRHWNAVTRKARNGYNIETGKKVEKLWHDLTPKSGKDSYIKGVPGALGSIKGTVKVLLSPKDIAKVKQGDILVSAMTTPDYILAIKKAAAIVTDEGGITSHAVIVSRELGIPCIIGTKIATRVLKDGDVVEVDANNGIVKILKNF